MVGFIEFIIKQHFIGGKRNIIRRKFKNEESMKNKSISVKDHSRVS